MVELLNKIHEVTSGKAIIVGGVARWLNNYSPEYLRRWVDISIPSSYIGHIRTLGRHSDIQGDTTWPSPVLTQFVVVTEDKYILDVFVVDEPTEFNLVSGLNVITPNADLVWHQNMADKIKSQHLIDKVEKLKGIYNL